MRYRHFDASSFAFLILVLFATGPVAAQILPPVVEQPTTILQPPLGYPPTTATSAAGPYFATPSWDQKLAPNVRFVVLTNFGSDAVLDRETGLVWARQATTSAIISWLDASAAAPGCRNLDIAGRGGWRLPTAAEFQTLIDYALPASPSTPRLPVGHPFVLSLEGSYWTSESFHEPTLDERLAWSVSLISGVAHPVFTDRPAGFALCVRGRQ